MARFQGFILVLSLVQFGGCEFFDRNCKGIECHAPPDDAKCETVDDSDKEFTKPSGPKSSCCPLWKCKRQNDVHFFTFHGLQGGGNKIDGSETVKYENNGQMGRSVNSIADGAHDSVANAGDSIDMAELDAALKAAGAI